MKPDDGREDVVEIVGDAAGQRAEGLHLLRLAELGFDLLPLPCLLLQLIVGLLQLGSAFFNALLQVVAGPLAEPPRPACVR